MRSPTRHMVLAAVATLVVAGLGAGTGLAQDKNKIIAERQELMTQQGREMVVVRNYFQDKADQAAAIAAMESLKKSVPTVANYFPPGTEGPSPDGKWAPKPEVWSEHDKFLAADKKVADQLAALDAAVKSGDKTRVEAQFKEIGFCSACHDTFRAKLQ